MVKTHTFRLGKYRIEEANGLDGCCDIPGDDDLGMIILEGNTLKALNTAIHEAMHAEDIPESIVHGGAPDRIARLLWRLGWRRNG